MSGCPGQTQPTHVDSIPNMLDLLPRYNLLEVIKHCIPGVCMREVCDGGWARPADDGGEEDADKDGAADAIHHHKDSHDPRGR